jgi:septum formation protein
MFQLILGSQSPRRKDIMSFFDIPFKVTSPAFDEDSVPFNGDPEKFVACLSKGKADSLSGVFPHAVLLTADTIVYQNGKIYKKPLNAEEAKMTLQDLSGKWHSVFTGITLQQGCEQFHRTEETRVLFNSLTEGNIKDYVKRCHWYDKAGGYGIQTGGGLLINKIDGCFYNVMGLPINSLKDLFFKIGIDLWKHIKS